MFLITAWDGAVLGCCGIGMRDGEHPEIGYWLGVAFWGKGYATEAVRALIDHAFGELGHDVLVSGARVSNPASRRVLEKCGFEWTGVGLYRIRALALVGAGRSLPSRPRPLGLAQKLGGPRCEDETMPAPFDLIGIDAWRCAQHPLR